MFHVHRYPTSMYFFLGQKNWFWPQFFCDHKNIDHNVFDWHHYLVTSVLWRALMQGEKLLKMRTCSSPPHVFSVFTHYKSLSALAHSPVTLGDWFLHIVQIVCLFYEDNRPLGLYFTVTRSQKSVIHFSIRYRSLRLCLLLSNLVFVFCLETLLLKLQTTFLHFFCVSRLTISFNN